jgi:(p)ppGpp synthase/HD superfamily hydrolase
MPFSQELYARALAFSACAHGEQKTPTGLPYVVHVASVAMEVMAALRAEPGHDEDLAIVCALLHDVVEDTPTTLLQVEAEFGARIAAGVAALTKDASRDKSSAMRDSLDRILREPPEIAMVKLADRTTNMAPPPRQWTESKIAAYRAEAELILETLGAASVTLAARLRERIDRYPPVP